MGVSRGAAVGASSLDPILPVTWTSPVSRPSTASSCTVSPWLGTERVLIYIRSTASVSCPRALQGEVAFFLLAVLSRTKNGNGLEDLCGIRAFPSWSSVLYTACARVLGRGAVCHSRAWRYRVEGPGLHQQGLPGSQPRSGGTTAGPGALEPQVGGLPQSPLFCSPDHSLEEPCP